MDYQTFCDEVVRRLRERFQEDMHLEVQPVRKNNAVVMDALSMREAGQQMTPLVYLEQYYQMYLRGDNIDRIVEKIVDFHRLSRLETAIDERRLRSWDQIKDHIVPRLVNTSLNVQLLKDLPHRGFLDLSIIYACRAVELEGMDASFLICQNHMQLWEATEQMLYEAALRNMNRLIPPVLQSMEQMMQEMMEAEFAWDYTPDPQLYVLTNTQRSYGAVWMIREDQLQRAAQAFDSDFYLLPSSVHECILVPGGQLQVHYLEKMVQEINETQVAAQEVLGNSVYRYSRRKGALRLCSAPPKM